MNEILKEFAVKARLVYVLENLSMPYIEEDLDNFAQRIIKECADRVEEFSDMRIPASEYSNRLKESFGLK